MAWKPCCAPISYGQVSLTLLDAPWSSSRVVSRRRVGGGLGDVRRTGRSSHGQVFRQTPLREAQLVHTYVTHIRRRFSRDGKDYWVCAPMAARRTVASILAMVPILDWLDDTSIYIYILQRSNQIISLLLQTSLFIPSSVFSIFLTEPIY